LCVSRVVDVLKRSSRIDLELGDGRTEHQDH